MKRMVKTPQISWDSRQSEVRDELTDATNLEISGKFMRQSRWMNAVDERTTEIPQEIEETLSEVKRRTKDARTKAARGGQEEATDGSDLRQGGRVEDVPADGITKRQS